MEMYEGIYYEVESPRRESKLADTFDSYEEAVEAMKNANRRAISNGYHPTEFIITRTIWRRIFDSQGVFRSCTRDTIRIDKDGAPV